MADYRSDAIANLEALDRAAQRCEAQLASARAAYRVGLAQLRSGTTVADALTVSQASVVRGEMTAAIDALECARRASRVSHFLADLHEGSSVKAVAARWGVSRQLVSRSLSMSRGATPMTDS